MADIQNILAALAAQRQNGTPSQAPPGAPPAVPGAGYPPPPQYAAPPGAAAYGLPQPINSGSVDLASLNPVNSGQVNFNDALAKARESYDPNRPGSRNNDPRAASRTYRRSRSPSRSPPRVRDEYRDNFNPYRDERRGGNDRGFRDRSYSPGRGGSGGRAGGHYSPAAGFQGPRSPGRDSANDDSETLPVEKSLVGLIIGRAGENLRRVENTTGARVQFMDGPETAGSQRHCKISGTRSARAAAKAEIFRAIEDNEAGGKAGGGRAPDRSRGGAGRPSAGGAGMMSATAVAAAVAGGTKDGNSLQILVPDRTVGLIIGRGGETIKDLQDRSGCHVNITAEAQSVNGMRPVNLIGSPQSQAHAKDLIMEIVESDQKGISVKELRNRGRESNQDSGEKINDSIMVPGDSVGMIIGKGGETIRDMQNSTGCKINVSPPSGRDVEREIGLIGTRHAVEAAKRAILAKVDAAEARGRGGGGGGGGRESRGDYANPNPYPGQSAYPAAAAAPAQQAPAAGGEDPYAAYGGYQNYAAMWYAAVAAQQQAQGQQPGEQR
ncbi:Far upstream element-binding protein 1 [Cyphellophora attinorum]|uniref:Far upstream element-binding protein 1 n=1 Tax=Cyphellophora attinorum TaxID=1664694 RepID=A0A0N1H522_9EURO|nr:Far upstream element-binding protein 1 [Phialophora attinorum]KPI40664.1 Far upstream element-binding protein 1 [Phialophora attinorum]